MTDKPRVLITGFSAFPGAPKNPTQVLVSLFDQHSAEFEACADITAVLLPTEYAYVDAEFSALMDEINPDIALHFGLNQQATGFTLEQTARNICNVERLDNAGAAPKSPEIDPKGPANLSGSLPLLEIRRALANASLPVEMSDDAGGYVCNYLFYRSRQLVGKNTMSGFIHVPLLNTQTDDNRLATLTQDQLWAGVMVIIETVISEWQRV